MTLKLRLMLTVSAISIMAIALMGWQMASLASAKMEAELLVEVENKLTSNRELVKARIENYFSRIERQITAMSQDVAIVEAAQEFSRAFNQYTDQRGTLTSSDRATMVSYYENEFATEYSNQNTNSVNPRSMYTPLDEETLVFQTDYISLNENPLGSKDALYATNNGSDYDRLHQRYHPMIRAFLQEFGYYDIFIVNPDSGKIIYSVFKELDFATSLRTGPYADTGIGQAFKKALSLGKGKTHLTDFDAYLPSYHNPASFISAPIYAGNTRVGVLIFQMPIDDMNNVMTQDQQWVERGFGESGEIYLVGQDNTLRNESRFLVEDPEGYLAVLNREGISEASLIKAKNTSISLQPVKTPGVTEALAGLEGFSLFPDYRNINVFSAYGPVKVGHMTWAIMSEIDEEEALRPLAALNRDIMVYTLIVGAVIVVISLGLAYVVSSYMTAPLRELKARFDDLSTGEADLTQTVPTSGIPEIDGISDGYNRFVGQIREIISSVKDSVSLLASSSTELSATTEETSQASQQQYSEARHVADSMKEFRAAIQEVAQNSVVASNNTSAANDSTRENADRAVRAADNIKQLVTEVTSSADVLHELQSEVANINEVLEVINTIADQTNLLALNAAIEAARAGEHGRGFAVVADEVRTLASRTQESTVEIQQKIAQLTNAANMSVESMQRASSSAGNGISLVEEVRSAMTELNSRINELSRINETVASATEEQNCTCEEINVNMQTFMTSAEQMTFASEEISRSAVSLSQIAENLHQQVERFSC